MVLLSTFLDLFSFQFLYNIAALKSGFVWIIMKNDWDSEDLMKLWQSQFKMSIEVIQLPVLETWKKRKEGGVFNLIFVLYF